MRQISIEEFYKDNILDYNFDEESYLLAYPYVKDFYQPHCQQNNIDDKHRLYFHWVVYGDKLFKDSLNLKRTTTNPSTETLVNHSSIKESLNILVKIPTLNRVGQLLSCLKSFYDNKSGLHNVKFLVCVNENDEITKRHEKEILSFINTNIEYGNYKSKIEAYNAGIENIDFDIIILASDDMVVKQKNYDSIIVNNMINYFPNLDGVLWFDTKDTSITNTLSIVGKKFFNKIGKIYNQIYEGYFCDDEFSQIAFKLGKMVRIKQSIIEHSIPNHLDMSNDYTYLKSLKHSIKDKARYKIRKKVQFDFSETKELPKDHKIPKEFLSNKRNKNWGNPWVISEPWYDHPLSLMDVYTLENTDKKVSTMSKQDFIEFSKNYFRDFRFSIPNVIHQIWLGGSPPEEIKNMMETFSIGYKQKHPHTRYILWDDEKLKSLNMINQDIFDQEKSYDCKSDIARLEVLNKFGGIYIDSDTIWLGEKSILSLQNQISYGILIAYEKDGTKIGSGYLDSQTTRCANGVFGSTIQNPIIAYLIGKLRESYKLNRKHGVVASTGPDFIQSTFDSLKSHLDINILSHKYFYPCWWSKNKKFNPQYDELIKLKEKTTKEICQKYPESILFHCGWEK